VMVNASIEQSFDDFRALGSRTGSYDVVTYDPPHIQDGGRNGIMAQRYGTYRAGELQTVVQAGTREAWRAARLGIVVKVCDHVHQQQLQWMTGWVREALDWRVPYEVVHQVRTHPLIDPKWQQQLSARNNGATYLVFRHGDQRHIPRFRENKHAP